MNTVLYIDKLQLTFDDGGSLFAEDIAINQGDFVIITGGNGIGKTTLFRLISLYTGKPYYTLDSRSKIILPHIVGLENKNIFTLDTNQCDLLRSKVAYASQEEDAVDNLSAYGQLLLDSEICIDSHVKGKKQAHQLLEEIADEYINKYLEFGGKKELKRKKNTALSGGQKKIISVLSTFLKSRIMGSNLVLLDEPLNNLDIKNKKLLNSIIEDARRYNPKLAIMMISHCRVFPAVNKELKFIDGKIKVATPVLYDCLDLAVNKAN